MESYVRRWSQLSCKVLSLLSELSHPIGRHSALQLKPPPFTCDSKVQTPSVANIDCFHIDPKSIHVNISTFHPCRQSQYLLTPKNCSNNKAFLGTKQKHFWRVYHDKNQFSIIKSLHYPNPAISSRARDYTVRMK